MAVEPDTFIEVAAALDLNTVRTATAQTSADTAQGTASDALTRVYGAELGAKTYTDAEIQEIRDYIDAELTSRINILAAALGIDITDLVNGALPSLDAAILQALSDLGVIKSAAETDRTAVEDAIANWVNNLIPDLETLLDQTVLGLNGVETTLGELTNGLEYTEIRAAVDDIRSQGEKDLVPLGVSTLRVPATLWGLNVDQANANLVKATLGTYGSFVTSDADFGECFHFAAGDEQNVGASYPLDYADGNLYKVTVTLKVLDDGAPASGVHVKIGATVQNGTSIALANQEQVFSPEYVTVADGVVKHTVYISSSQTKLDNYGTIAPEQILLTDPATATANKIYFHVRQNATGDTNGQLALASIVVLDVTETVALVDRKYTELSVETGNVKAWIGDDYTTAVSMDAAIATRTLALKSEMEGPTGSIGGIQADLTTNYVTNTSLTSSLASESTVLNSRFENVQDDVDAAQATASSALTTATTADTGLASLSTELNVDVNGNIAGVTNFGLAMADIKGDIEAGHWIKATANNSTASLSVYTDGTTSSIELDADNIIVNGSILTDLIGQDQVSQVDISESLSDLSGNSGWQTLVSASVTIPDNTGTVYAIWFISQGYTSPAVAGDQYGVSIGSYTRYATFGNDFLSGVVKIADTVGTHSVNLQWWGVPGMAANGKIILVGAKR